MEIDLPVHLVAAHQVIFHSMHAAVLDDHLVLRGPHHTEYALHVEVAVADTRIVRITLEIVMRSASIWEEVMLMTRLFSWVLSISCATCCGKSPSTFFSAALSSVLPSMILRVNSS